MYSEARFCGFSFKVWFGKFEPASLLKELIVEDGDIVLCGFNSFDEIDLSEEIMGDGHDIKSICDYSLVANAAVFCGIKTYILDVKNIGVCVCNKGRLVDIADRVSNPFEDEYGESNKLKIISASGGRVALFVDSDCLVDSHWDKIKDDADIVVCINQGNSIITQEEVRLLASVYSKPYIYIDDNGAEWRQTV